MIYWTELFKARRGGRILNMNSPKSPDSSKVLKPALVPLPFGEHSGTKDKKPAIWAINGTSELGVDLPSTAQCTHANGLCCRELNKEDRTLIDPDIVRDV